MPAHRIEGKIEMRYSAHYIHLISGGDAAASRRQYREGSWVSRGNCLDPGCLAGGRTDYQQDAGGSDAGKGTYYPLHQPWFRGEGRFRRQWSVAGIGPSPHSDFGAGRGGGRGGQRLRIRRRHQGDHLNGVRAGWARGHQVGAWHCWVRRLPVPRRRRQMRRRDGLPPSRSFRPSGAQRHVCTGCLIRIGLQDPHRFQALP